MNGSEWVVEAYGCSPVRLGDMRAMQALFDALVRELSLHPVGDAHWHRFPAPGGITGMLMLAESHLTLHTFPEYSSLCLNLFCCTPRAEWAWESRLQTHAGASEVRVRTLVRAYGGLANASAPEQRDVDARARALRVVAAIRQPQNGATHDGAMTDVK